MSGMNLIGKISSAIKVSVPGDSQPVLGLKSHCTYYNNHSEWYEDDIDKTESSDWHESYYYQF